MTFLQSYLRKFDSFEDAISNLENDYAIKAKKHNQYQNLYLFKYSQLNSPMGEKICQESRGIILDSNDNWNIVARPYDKFFNIEEFHAAKIDWSNSKVLEKLDGSLMTLYYYDNMWHVSTSGTPDAFGQVDQYDFSFKDLFWKVWGELNYKLPNDNHNNFSFMFELMTPYNKVVIQHKENKIILHGARNISNGLEMPPEFFADIYGWNCVNKYDFATLEDLNASIKEMNGLEQEGYVVVDSNFNRVKVKCLEYCYYSHIKENCGPRSFLDIIRNNENSEFLSYFPEYTQEFNEVKRKYECFVDDVTNKYQSIKHIVDQKEFALEATKIKFSFLLFGMRKINTNDPKILIVDLDIKKLESLINNY